MLTNYLKKTTKKLLFSVFMEVNHKPKLANCYLFIYLFMAALGLRCCARAFSRCSEQGLLFIAACGLLIAVASLVVEHGL